MKIQRADSIEDAKEQLEASDSMGFSPFVRKDDNGKWIGGVECVNIPDEDKAKLISITILKSIMAEMDRMNVKIGGVIQFDHPDEDNGIG